MSSNSQHGSGYKQKEDVWFDDGREELVLEYVRQHLDPSKTHSPEAVLGLIDGYGSKHKYLMNVGSEKGKIVTDLIAEHKPKAMLEFGSYVGYSTILFASALKKNGGTQYISFEREPKFAHVAQSLAALAGLSDVVRFVVGSSSKNLLTEKNAGRLGLVNMVFFDHYKPAYLRDLKICESLGMIGKDTVLAADNVISPGNPTYLEYVRSAVEDKQKAFAGQTEKLQKANSFPERTVNQYKDYEADDTELPGDPNLVYVSHLVPGHEPTGEDDGIEVTICKGTHFVPS